MNYKHGNYAEFGEDQVNKVDSYDAGVVYIGAAPINLVAGFSRQNINKPVTIKDMKEAKVLLGYSDDWKQYPLCEAMYAHFGNTSGNIGPVHFINVLDSQIHISDDYVEGNLIFEKKKATITDSKMIVDSFELTGKVKDKDYTLYYDMITSQLIITDISDAGIENNAFKYSQIEMSFDDMVEAVIGTENLQTGEVTGVKALKLVYQECNVIPELVLAPLTSTNCNVMKALKEATKSINGRFVAQYYCDIPLADAENNPIHTKESAIQWAKENEYDSEFSKNFYPMARKANRYYHISTLFAVTKMIVDMRNEGIPFETASNEVINIDGLYFGESAVNSGFDIEDANKLNSKGITTAINWGGNWRLWGGHTAAYDHSKETTQGKEIFDTSIAMQIFLANDFITSNSDAIDKRMSVGSLQAVINEQESKLDDLVSVGALTGHPKFVIDDSVDEVKIKSGGYGWVLSDTPTPQFKDATVKVVWTDEGYSTLIGGATDEN